MPINAPQAAHEAVRQLSPTEREWKQRIYDRLLKVLDLSLLGSLEEMSWPRALYVLTVLMS